MQKESFLSHPVFEKLEQLNQILSNDEIRTNIDLENLNYFETFYAYCKNKLNLTIPTLIQETELNNLLSEIDAGNVQINTFQGNKNIGHLNNAINNFNSALNRIRNLPFSITKSDFNFANSVAGFQKTVQEKYNEVNVKNEELQNELVAIQGQLADKNTLLQTLGANVAAKETEVQTILTKYNAEFDALKATVNSSFEADRSNFASKIEVDRAKFNEENEADKKKYETDFAVLVDTLNDSTTDTKGKLEEKLEEAKKIVNVVGDIGVTGNYQNIANENRTAANFWRYVAVAFMTLMTGLIVWSIIELSSREFDLYKSIVRIVAAAVLTYPAIYAARESSKHRKHETKNRNIELELAAIGPFIEMLPEAKKQQVKEELVKKYFANNNVEADAKEEEDISIGGLEKILKALLPLLKK